MAFFHAIGIIVVIIMVGAFIFGLLSNSKSKQRKDFENHQPERLRRLLSEKTRQASTGVTKGEIGELFVLASMYKMKGPCIIISTLYLPNDKQGNVTEIDAVAIHETGIYVVESKNYNGEIEGREDERMWRLLRNGELVHEFYNPIRQNSGHIHALSKALEVIHVKAPLHSVIAFGNQTKIKQVKKTSAEALIAQQMTLVHQLNAAADRNPVCLSLDEIARIHAFLQPFTEVSDETKQRHLEYVQKQKERDASAS